MAVRTTWTRPGFLLSFHGRGGASKQCCDPRLPNLSRGLSRRCNSRWTARASPTTGCEGDALAPQEPVYSWLLPTPACARMAVPQNMSWGRIRRVRTRLLSALPARVALVAFEDGGSALPLAADGTALHRGLERLRRSVASTWDSPSVVAGENGRFRPDRTTVGVGVGVGVRGPTVRGRATAARDAGSLPFERRFASAGPQA